MTTQLMKRVRRLDRAITFGETVMLPRLNADRRNPKLINQAARCMHLCDLIQSRINHAKEAEKRSSGTDVPKMPADAAAEDVL